jgi:hypothetical protein
LEGGTLCRGTLAVVLTGDAAASGRSELSRNLLATERIVTNRHETYTSNRVRTPQSRIRRHESTQNDTAVDIESNKDLK